MTTISYFVTIAKPPLELNMQLVGGVKQSCHVTTLIIYVNTIASVILDSTILALNIFDEFWISNLP